MVFDCVPSSLTLTGSLDALLCTLKYIRSCNHPEMPHERKDRRYCRHIIITPANTARARMYALYCGTRIVTHTGCQTTIPLGGISGGSELPQLATSVASCAGRGRGHGHCSKTQRRHFSRQRKIAKNMSDDALSNIATLQRQLSAAPAAGGDRDIAPRNIEDVSAGIGKLPKTCQTMLCRI